MSNSSPSPVRIPLLRGTRLLNHTELVYAPGERGTARRLFELLGCRVEDVGADHLIVVIDPASKDLYDNCLYASEVTGEQWELEQALARHRTDDPELESRIEAYRGTVRRAPDHVTHFGIRIPTEDELEAILERIDRADGDLAGRVQVVKTLRPGDPGSLDPTLVQVWVRTDVCAAGLLALGQHIELQVPVPPPPSG